MQDAAFRGCGSGPGDEDRIRRADEGSGNVGQSQVGGKVRRTLEKSVCGSANPLSLDDLRENH